MRLLLRMELLLHPPLIIRNYQVLPVICFWIFCAKDGSIPVEERVVTMDEVANADEVWITSSSKKLPSDCN